MKSGEELREAIIRACQQAASEVGADLKQLSWFYRNSLIQRETLKKAA